MKQEISENFYSFENSINLFTKDSLILLIIQQKNVFFSKSEKTINWQFSIIIQFCLNNEFKIKLNKHLIIILNMYVFSVLSNIFLIYEQLKKMKLKNYAGVINWGQKSE